MKWVSSCGTGSLPIGGSAPDLVHLLPRSGEVRARDGRRFRLVDPSAVIAASLQGVDLPIDYEHQNDDPARFRNGPAPAAGWITDLIAKQDGIWGRVSWTAQARKLIAARAYRYLSPTFAHAKDGTILRVKGAGLVHTPALELTALARQETRMSDLARIAAVLDLDEDADIEAILDALAQRSGTPDPARYVPIEAVRDLIRERGEEKATTARAEAEAKVARACSDGLITPGMRDWAVSLCRQDATSFDAFLSSAVPICQPSGLDGLTRPAARMSSASDEGAAICKQLGLNMDDLRD